MPFIIELILASCYVLLGLIHFHTILTHSGWL